MLPFPLPILLSFVMVICKSNSDCQNVVDKPWVCDGIWHCWKLAVPNFGAVGGTSNNVGGVRKFFCAIMVPQSPIGLISAEIGALCRILGHTNYHGLSSHIDFLDCRDGDEEFDLWWHCRLSLMGMKNLHLGHWSVTSPELFNLILMTLGYLSLCIIGIPLL